MLAAAIYNKNGEIEAETEYVFSTEQEARNAMLRYISAHPQPDED